MFDLEMPAQELIRCRHPGNETDAPQRREGNNRDPSSQGIRDVSGTKGR